MNPVQTRIEAWVRKQARSLFCASPDFNDAETVHQMRVASRRLRIGLQFLGMPRSAALARLGRALGAVRVLDVNLQLLRSAPVPCPAVERRLQQARAKRVAELRRIYARTKPVEVGQCRHDARRALTELHRALRKRLARFEENPSSETFHKLRIALKKYRYGLEIVGEKKRLKQIKRLQELMGACHDIEVLLEWLPKGELREHFLKEHKRCWKAARKFLDGRRGWVKKLKWDDE
ncbi:MAG: CHAD domain-containing protein [Verrucomicrobiae bacterium]|nr:CHAD domain-containing protein [Verrucomicrobiae bacterium]